MYRKLTFNLDNLFSSVKDPCFWNVLYPKSLSCEELSTPVRKRSWCSLMLVGACKVRPPCVDPHLREKTLSFYNHRLIKIKNLAGSLKWNVEDEKFEGIFGLAAVHRSQISAYLIPLNCFIGLFMPSTNCSPTGSLVRDAQA